MLNVLHHWCDKWRLAVNEAKTKIMHFRNKSKLKSNVLFSCGNKEIGYSDSYKYLGFWFNEFFGHGKVNHRNNEICKKKVESVINKACRYFLGVSKNAPNISSKGDMGWVSAEVKQKLETVRLWCRLRNMPDDRTIRKIHNWSFSIGRSWENRMLNLFDSLSLQDSMLAPSPSKLTCLALAKEKLIEIDTQNWRNQLFTDGNGIDSGNKLRTYRKYKETLNTEPYVKMNMSRDHRRILAKFRSCNIPLAVETGRNTKPKTPHAERLCKLCDSATVEDGLHFLIDCDFYSDIRYELFHFATNAYIEDIQVFGVNMSFISLSEVKYIIFHFTR